MNPTLSTILQNTYTLTELKHKLGVLKAYLNHNFYGGTPQNFDASELSWLKSLPSSLIQSFNADNMGTVFPALEKEVAGLKALTIYLTFEPDKDSIALIGQKVRQSFQINLLDVKYDPSLIAGAAFVWKGIKKDYSLKAQIEQKKTQILENFKKYLTK